MTNAAAQQGQGNYVIFHGTKRSEYCVLGFLQGFPDSYKLAKGHAVAKEWPDDVAFHMDPDYDKRIKLSDNLANADDLIVASPRLQEFLRQEAVPDIEFLPVKVFNHKKKLATAEYAIVNQTATQDCVDQKRSVLVWNQINPDDITLVEKLVLEEKRIHPKATLFRAKHFISRVLVRRDLAAKMTAAGHTAIQFKEVATFQGT